MMVYLLLTDSVILHATLIPCVHIIVLMLSSDHVNIPPVR